MSAEFPTIGIVGAGPLVSMLNASALVLGVDIVNLGRTDIDENYARFSVVSVIGEEISASRVTTLEIAGAIFRPNSESMNFIRQWNANHLMRAPVDAVFSVLVARSPHGQASAWTPTEVTSDLDSMLTITPPPTLNRYQIAIAQEIALALIQESNVSGVMEVEIVLKDGELLARAMHLGPTSKGAWTIEGSRTSQFEQHIRAILDLPLGDPGLLTPTVVSASYSGEANMYRPYLHLMARSPAMKIHQYRSGIGHTKGHVTAMGRNLLDLTECVTHAVKYMSGVIDE